MKLNKLSQMIFAAALTAIPFTALAQDSASPEAVKVAMKVRRELVTLPFYGVFDNLSFELNDGTLILHGAVTRPTLKTSAERVAQRVDGVKSVINRIEVLPLSNFDDGIRLRVLRAVYGQPALQRYQLGAQPSIRILVKNGEVTLEGVVLNEMERNIANIQANAVFGVFKVNNNLRVEVPPSRRS